MSDDIPAVIVGIPCRFAERGCKSPAIGLYYIPLGCLCWPDPVQALCAQHAEKVESDGPITPIMELQS
jgi:hypothetical protein